LQVSISWKLRNMRTMDKQQHKLSIFGRNYVVATDESAECVVKSAEQIDSLLKSAAEKMPKACKEQVAILVCLQLAADLTKVRQELTSIKAKTEQCTRIIEQELNVL